MSFIRTKEIALDQIQYLIKLSGKRRFQMIFQIYSQIDEKDLTASRLKHNYIQKHPGCWEHTIFDERLQNNGFQRHSQDAVGLFMQRFIEVMSKAKEFNLIK